MTWIKDVFMLSIASLLTFANCDVIRFGKDVNGNILLPDVNAADNNIFEDNDADEANNHIDLDESLRLRLKDVQTFRNGAAYHHDEIPSVHHFARHGLCRNIEGKARFYTAMVLRLCHTNSKFITQLVDDLCTSKDRHLDNWVAELFDLNGDGLVDHYERHFYETED